MIGIQAETFVCGVVTEREVWVQVERAARAEVAGARGIVAQDAGHQEGDARIHHLHRRRCHILIENVASAVGDVIYAVEWNELTIVGENCVSLYHLERCYTDS